MDKRVKLYIPKLEDLWFRQECMSDPKTMNYNAGYNVSYDGYHYDTGCIDFPKSKWENWYEEKMKNKNFFYAYIVDIDINEYVGYVNFNNNVNTNKASMGIVVNSKYHSQGYMRPAMKKLIDEAKRRGIEYLTDTVPINRENALRVFFDMGFIVTKKIDSIKFNEKELVYQIEKKL